MENQWPVGCQRPKTNTNQQQTLSCALTFQLQIYRVEIKTRITSRKKDVREATEAQNGCVADSQTDVGREAGEAASIPLTRAIKPRPTPHACRENNKNITCNFAQAPKNTRDRENMVQCSWDILTKRGSIARHVLVVNLACNRNDSALFSDWEKLKPPHLDQRQHLFRRMPSISLSINFGAP